VTRTDSRLAVRSHASPSSASAEIEYDGLRRRVYLGMDLDSTRHDGGLLVNGVRAGGPAEEADVRARDRIAMVNGLAVATPADVMDAVRDVQSGSGVRIGLLRDGMALDVSATARPRPVEAIATGRVVLGHAVAGSTRLRTILTLPAGAGPWPCVLHLQGIDVASCEHPLEPSHPVLRLASDFAREGYSMMRVERSGVGDSEGPPPAKTDLEAEVETALAAFHALSNRDLIDPSRIFLFGHSIGGMIAPVLASRARACGIIVFGTSAKRWRTCAVGTTERQLALKGYTGEELSGRVAAWAEMHAAVCRDGRTPGEAMARRPHLSILASRQCQGETLFGRNARFFRQLDALPLSELWRALTVPVLVLRGENDWVCDASDAESVVARATERAVPGRVDFLELPRMGHDMLSHASLEASFHRPREGTWNGHAAAAAVAWMRERINGP